MCSDGDIYIVAASRILIYDCSSDGSKRSILSDIETADIVASRVRSVDLSPVRCNRIPAVASGEGWKYQAPGWCLLQWASAVGPNVEGVDVICDALSNKEKLAVRAEGQGCSSSCIPVRV